MVTTIDEIRDYLGKIAAASGLGDNAAWAARAGLSADTLDRFKATGDISLTDYLALCAAAGAIALPIPASKLDEAVMLIEDEGIYAEGTTPSPFDRYRHLLDEEGRRSADLKERE